MAKAEEKNTQRSLNYLLFSWMQVVFIAALLGTTLSFLEIPIWFLDLSTHFHTLYLGFSLVLLLYFFCVRKKKLGLISLALVILNACCVLPLYVSEDSSSSHPFHNEEKLKLLLANVNSDNKDHPSFITLIQKEDPDIFMVQETNAMWEKALHPLINKWPHHLSIPRSDNFGIALYSKIPLDKIKDIYIGKAEVPSIVIEFKFHNKKYHLLTTHTLPPIGADYFNYRNQQFNDTAAYLKSNNNEKIWIVAGDLNCSPWSPYFNKLIADSGLKNARKGFGLLPTWPTQVPFLQIPIDHCLVDPRIKVEQFYCGPPIGSDHLPLIIELSF